MPSSDKTGVAGQFSCPACRDELINAIDGLSCQACQKTYPLVGGVPDLRLLDIKTNALFADDAQRAQILRSRSPSLSLPELIRLCYELPGSRTKEALDCTVSFMLNGKMRMGQLLEGFSDFAAEQGWQIPKGGRALDLGSGCGMTTSGLLQDYVEIYGINPAEDEMVVAQKINQEQHEGKINFCLALGEQLPFPDNFFELVVAADVIEHVVDPKAVLREIERVLKPGGMLLANSPNKYNIFTPDGHVHIKYVGFIPSLFREAYVRWRTGGASWKLRNIRLLSYGQLRSGLKKLQQSRFIIQFLSADEKKVKTWKFKLITRFSLVYQWLRSEHNCIVQKMG